MPRIWFITGCSSGFGRQLAIAAAQNKDTVVATSRDPSKLADLAPLGIIPKKLDVRASDTEVQAVVDDVVANVGPIDILVNNAGYILEGAVEECSDQEIFDQFDTNVFSQIRVLRAALPSMRTRKSGVVANFGSIGGWSGSPAAGMYCASKAAIAIYTESLRHELVPLSIEVTCIEPGYFRTNFLTGDHKITAQNRIPDLHASTQATRDALAAYSLNQPGDPVKGAQVLVEALTKSGRCEGRSLPGRLALGRDAIAAIGGSLSREQNMLDSWGEIIGSTNCDDVKS
ncbi:hypothetical protein BDW59DRAFT_64255 [Aspergillus cavernicola]|uniref:3-oxoacyl-reductase n=1 Tax=Aspergillus cavernicola TaxID=176166 RepID=A0ABR4J3Y0_9EURO